ncbi:DUF554 domain-containing protein [Natranaerobius trueperi]|nr:DUF554 domain-containing protein [Natranaerobius trueperi]
MITHLGDVLTGTLVNTGAIVAGGIIGLIFRKGISDELKKTVLQGIGLVVTYLGMSMAFETENVLILIFSVVIGGILGELGNVEQRLNSIGESIKKRIGNDEDQFIEGFIFATLVYCVGALAIVGSLESGLNQNHEILFAKSVLDGTTAIAFTSSLGIGVLFSSVPVLFYQGVIAVFSGRISHYLEDGIVAELSSVGGILILAIGLNIIEVTKINVANLLPGILIAAVLANLFI